MRREVTMGKKRSGDGKGGPALDALRKAAKGLQFISETEAPLKAFLWDDGDTLTDRHLLELVGEDEGAGVEQQSLDDFFHAVPDEDREKFDELAKVLKEQLSGIKVYKVGDEAERNAYVVGKTAEGRWAGLKTTVVET
jgi:histidine triad (HIT) family protein